LENGGEEARGHSFANADGRFVAAVIHSGAKGQYFQDRFSIPKALLSDVGKPKRRWPQPLKVARGRFRSPDPSFDTDGHFIYRRIAPDSRKVELGDDPGSRLNRDLLRAMGFDLGSIHAAHPMHVREIEGDLERRPTTWIEEATEKAVAAVRADYNDWAMKATSTDDARKMRKR
jgi:hypothetical protein